MRLITKQNRGLSAYGVAVMLVILFFIVIAVPQYKYLRESVRKVACNHKKELLARSLEMCLNIGVSQVQPPYKEVDQVKLEQLKVLNVRVECGSGGFYKVNKSQQTYCTLHEAASDW